MKYKTFHDGESVFKHLLNSSDLLAAIIARSISNLEGKSKCKSYSWGRLISAKPWDEWINIRPKFQRLSCLGSFLAEKLV